MKKILIVLLIAGFVLSSVNAFAYMERFNQDQKVKVAIFSNPSTAAGQQVFQKYVTDTSAGILVPGVHRILGYHITPCLNATLNRGYETWVAMYDSARSGMGGAKDAAQPNLAKLEAEIETTAATGNTFIYPYPYEIKEGVVIYLGPNATVTILYEDYRR